MIASGRKTIETRKWPTRYRGPILIVSSKSPKIEPAGYALAIAEIIDCRPMTKEDEPAAGCEIYSGAFSWVLQNIKKIKPFPVKGRLGIYDVELPADIRTAQVKKTPEYVHVYCPDCMEEWSANPDQIGEKCGYCHEGTIQEEEPTYPTTPEGVFELAKQVFPVTSGFQIAGWLLPDGTLIALTYGGSQRDRDHGEVARLFEEPLERWEAVNKFRDMGAIRISPLRNDGYAIEMSVMPSQEQFEQIRRLLGTARELEVEIFGAGRDGRFYQSYPYGTSMEEVYGDLKAAFAGGGRSELMQYHNSKSWYRTASALPRGTFEPLENIIERLSASLEMTSGIQEVLDRINTRLAPLNHFRKIEASVDGESIVFVDDENHEACSLHFESGVPVVESAHFENLDNFQKAASSIAGNRQWKKT